MTPDEKFCRILTTTAGAGCIAAAVTSIFTNDFNVQLCFGLFVAIISASLLYKHLKSK